MKYDFNEKIDRSENKSAKWDELESKFGDKDLIPMWIADMDLKAPSEIVEAIQKKVAQGIYGYTARPKSYYEAAANWTKRKFDFDVDPNSLLHTPNGVISLTVAIEVFTKVGETVLIFPPVYPGFYKSIEGIQRKLVTSPLLKNELGEYSVDFEGFEKQVIENDVKLIVMCNPHNPIGRVYTKEELERVANICLKHNVRIISDELWRDLVFTGHKHIPMASISPEVEKITITIFSATKSFNLAGLHSAFVALPVESDRLAYEDRLEVLDVKRNNAISIVAIETAFNECEKWLEEVLIYLEDNMNFSLDYIKNNIPELKVVKPEGTYTLWVDFSNIGIKGEELIKFLTKEGKVALGAGHSYGIEGESYVRLNFACPRYLLEEGLKRIKTAVQSVGGNK